MKKFSSIILTLSLLVASAPLGVFASDTNVVDTSIHIENSLACQEKLKVSFTKPDNLNGITAFQFKLTLPDGFDLKSANSLLPSNWGLYYSENTDRYVLYSGNITTLETTATANAGVYDLLELELTLDETVTDGDYTAKIKVEDIASDNFTSNKGTNEVEYNFTYTEHDYLNGSCSVCGELEKHKVTFLDKMGNVIYTALVEDGNKVSSKDIDAAAAAVPEIYGYTKAFDNLGAQAWNGDITQAIYSDDVVFTALYNKAEERYTITVNYTNGSERQYSYRFNEKLIILDELATYWVLKDSHDVIVATSINNESVYYVSGDANLMPKTDTPPTTALLNFVKTATGTQNGKRTYTVFAHATNVEVSDIKACGVSFMSNAQYTALAARADVTQVLWKDQTFTKEESASTTPVNYTLGGKLSCDFMVTLTNISATKAQMRWAQAYVILKDGTAIVTETPVSQLFPAQE